MSKKAPWEDDEIIGGPWDQDSVVVDNPPAPPPAGDSESKYGVMESAFPRISSFLKSLPEDRPAGVGADPESPYAKDIVGAKEGMRFGLNAGLDATSAVGRAIASLPALVPGGETFGQAFSRTEGKERTGALGKLVKFGGDVVRDPATAVTGALTAGLGPVIGAGLKGASLPAKMGIGALVGAGEGTVSAAVHQAENVGEGRKISPVGAASEIGASTVLGGVGPAVKAGIGKVSNAVGDFLKTRIANNAEIPKGILERAANNPDDVARAAAAIKATDGGDFSGKANEIVGDVLEKRADVDRVVREIEGLKSDALTKEIGPSRSAYKGGTSIKESAEEAYAAAGELFGRKEDAILRKSGMENLPLGSGAATSTGNVLENELDSFIREIQFDLAKGFGAKGNRVVPAEAVGVITAMKKQLGAQETLGDALKMRRVIDQKINFGGADNGPLFGRGSDSEWALKEMRNRVNAAIEHVMTFEGEAGDDLAKLWRANNKAYSEVLDAIDPINKAGGKTNSEALASKIAGMGVDRLNKLKAEASKDPAMAPVWEEVKNGFMDTFIHRGTKDNGIDYAAFKEAWGSVDDTVKSTVLGKDRVAQVELALSAFAPDNPRASTLGKEFVGATPSTQGVTRKLENIGSADNRESMKQLKFLEDILGVEDSQRVSSLAEDAYFGKQLKMDPTGRIPTTNNLRTGKSLLGKLAGAGTGAIIGSAVGGPGGAVVGSVAGDFAGTYAQSPAAALAAFRAMNAGGRVASRSTPIIGTAARYGTRALINNQNQR